MSELVGGIHYEVDLDTGKLIEGQRRVKRELDATSGSLNGFSSKLSGVASAVSVLAVAMAALKSAQMADDMRMLGARVEVAAGSIESGAAAMAALEAISKRTQTSVSANAEVFTRLNQSMLQMGGTQQDTLNLTELLGKAIKVSGASAVEAKSAMLQFGQALGSGKLAGDELRSLMETAPYLMKKLADGIGVPVGALKKMGEEGKLTADVVTNALNKASTQIDADFRKFPQTIASAMDVAMDAAGRANSKLDELTGTSLALTGVTKGMGDVFDELAKQFGAANDEAGILGRNEKIKTWAEATKTVLSYVVDASDFVARGFRQLGTGLGGLAAGAGAAMAGNFSGAREILSSMITDINAIGNAPMAGKQMRDAWTAGQGSGRGSVNPQAGPSKLTAPKDEKKKAVKKSADEKFDDAGYLAGLKKNTVEAWDAVTAAETEAHRKNDKLLAEKKISHVTHEEAKTLITKDATNDRQKLIEEGTQKYLQEMDAQYKKEQQIKEQAMQYGAALTKAVNPIDALRQEYQAKLEIVTQYEKMMAKAGVDSTKQGQITRTQIESEYQLQRLALAEQSFRSQSEANAFLMNSLNAFSQTATSSIVGLINGTSNATDMMRNLANVVLNEAVSSLVQIGIQQVKNAFLGDTIAAADSARKAANGAVYAASVAAQVTGMSAMAAQNAFAATAAIPIIGPGLAPAAAAAAGAAAAGLGAGAIVTAPIAGARQYGGPVNSGSLYRVNETGAPEMFTAGNGQQYMMPTQGGRVTAADKVGGGSVVVNVSVDASGSSAQGNSTSAAQLGNLIGNAVRGVLAQEKRPGGMLA